MASLALEILLFFYPQVGASLTPKFFFFRLRKAILMTLLR
jgi:hypothetical protein